MFPLLSEVKQNYCVLSCVNSGFTALLSDRLGKVQAGGGEQDTCSSWDQKQMVHMAPAPRGENLSAEPQLRSHCESERSRVGEEREGDDQEITLMWELSVVLQICSFSFCLLFCSNSRLHTENYRFKLPKHWISDYITVGAMTINPAAGVLNRTGFAMWCSRGQKHRS